MTLRYDDFVDRHVLVTGAASGIGRAVALAFAGQGAAVSAIDRDAHGLEQTAKADDRIRPIDCDLSEVALLRAGYADATAALGPVAVLVNNAGVDRRIPVDDVTADDWRWMLAVNLDHHMFLSQLAARDMAAAGGGAIVNMSSTAWMKLAGNLTAYHAAKAAIVGLTVGLARDLGPRGIRVNAIAPGRVMTERGRRQATPAWIEDTKMLQCLPSLIEPTDIAQAALWLSSSGARMVTGQTLIVDGGVVR